MSTRASVPVSTEDAYVGVQPTTGGDFLFLPGTSGITESGGDAPTREIATFANVVTHTGNARPPSISITVAAFIPIHPTYKIISDAHKNNTPLNFQYTFAGRVIKPSAGSGNTASIAANTGAVTFAGSNNPDFTQEDIGPGMSIKIGSKHYIIRTISESGAVTVVDPDTFAAPTGQVAAAVFSVEIPQLTRPSFSARVMNFGNLDAQVDGDLATTVEIQPRATLPDWRVAS